MITEEDKKGILERRLWPDKFKVTYCGHCKDRTAHEIIKGEGGQSLNCVRCGCDRLDTIQGFDAALM